MSKAVLLDATCEDGKVTAEGQILLSGVTILSEGVGESSGVLLLDGDKAYFISKASPDLKTTLTKVITALEKIADALDKANTTALVVTGTCPPGGGPLAAGTTIPGFGLAGDISAISSAKSDLETLKGMLK